jgi:hypothetical protein
MLNTASHVNDVIDGASNLWTDLLVRNAFFCVDGLNSVWNAQLELSFPRKDSQKEDSFANSSSLEPYSIPPLPLCGPSPTPHESVSIWRRSQPVHCWHPESFASAFGCFRQGSLQIRCCHSQHLDRYHFKVHHFSPMSGLTLHKQKGKGKV